MKGPGVIHRCRLCGKDHKTRAHAAITENGNGMGATITCACGCGSPLTEMDDQKRARRFLNGHNKREWWANLKQMIGGER